MVFAKCPAIITFLFSKCHFGFFLCCVHLFNSNFFFSNTFPFIHHYEDNLVLSPQPQQEAFEAAADGLKKMNVNVRLSAACARVYRLSLAAVLMPKDIKVMQETCDLKSHSMEGFFLFVSSISWSDFVVCAVIFQLKSSAAFKKRTFQSCFYSTNFIS